MAKVHSYDPAPQPPLAVKADRVPSSGLPTSRMPPSYGLETDPVMAQYFERYLNDQRTLGRLVSPQSLLHQKIEPVLREVIKELGFPANNYALHIISSSRINAFVFRGVAPAPIVLTTGLLLALAERYDGLTEGHLAVIHGHETAHVRDGAYKRPVAKSPVICANEVFESRRSEVERVGEDQLRLLEARAGGRDEEYACDRHGIRAARRIGATDAEPIEVLKLFAERSQAARDDEKAESSRRSKLDMYGAIIGHVTATHPASQRRVDKGQGYQRLLSGQGERPRPDAARRVVLTAEKIREHSQPSRLHGVLRKLTEGLVSQRTVAGSEKFLAAAISQAQTVEELQHVALVAGLHLRAISPKLKVPGPGGAAFVRKKNSFGEVEEVKEAAPEVSSELRDQLRDRLGELLRGSVSEIEQSVLGELIRATLDHFSSFTSGDVDQAVCTDPIAVIHAVGRYGASPIDVETLHPQWQAMVLESTVGGAAENIFAAGRIDLRPQFFESYLLFDQAAKYLDSFTAVARCMAATMESVPDLLAHSPSFIESLAETMVQFKDDSRLGDVPGIAVYQEARAALGNVSKKPQVTALALAPLAYNAGYADQREVLKGIASDQELAPEVRSILGTIFLSAYLQKRMPQIPRSSDLENLAFENLAQEIIELKRESGIVLGAIPTLEIAGMTHSMVRPTSASKLEPFHYYATKHSVFDYPRLPVYRQGFSRTLLLFVGGIRGSDTFPNFAADYSDWRASLCRGWLATREEMADEPDTVSADAVKALVMLSRIGGSDPLEVRDSWVDRNRRVMNPYQVLVGDLVEVTKDLSGLWAATQDVARIKSKPLKDALTTPSTEDVDDEGVSGLISDVTSNALPLLNQARLYISSSRLDPAQGMLVGQGGHEVDQTLELFSNYRRFVEHRLMPRSVRDEKVEETSSLPELLNLENITFLIGRSLFDLHYVYGPADRVEAYAKKSVMEKLDLITSHFIAASAERDKHLLDVLGELPDGSGNFEVKKRIFEALYSVVHTSRLGSTLYDERLAQSPDAGLQERLGDIMTYLPIGSSRRETEVARLYDGVSGAPGLVQSWADHRRVQARLATEDKASAKEQLLRGAGLGLLLEALEDDRVSPSERARVLLWIAGLRQSTVLVECAELATNRRLRDLKKESDLLTASEKEQILYEALAGAKGILRDQGPGRDIFLNTLFIGIFKPLVATEQTLKECKACFDTMMRLDEPERAARFLASCMVGYLEKLREPEQVKLLFSSYGALGPKLAQQLVARTSLFSPETREALMDLTSRVPDGSCAELYDALERRYGADVERFVMKIDPAGGGSFQQVWRVRLWNDDCTGPGETLICCKLRPDVVVDLGGDLRTTQGLADAMEAAPERFGGAHLNRRTGRVIALQSALETSYPFIIEQQEGARASAAQEGRKKRGPLLSIPAIVTSHSYRDVAGARREVELTNGEFIFMKNAPGVTLDRYLAENPKDTDQIYRAVTGYLVRQALTGGYLHCDLHPGNILIDRSESGQLTISCIDWGISTKNPTVVAAGLQQLIRIAIGGKDEGLTLQGLWRTVSGVGAVDKDVAVKAIGDFVSLLGVASRREVSPEESSRIGRELYQRLVDEKISFQEKIQSLDAALSAVGVEMPLSLDYTVRGLGTLSYMWKELGEKTIWSIIKDELRRVERADALLTIDAKALENLLGSIVGDVAEPRAAIQESVRRIRAAPDTSAKLATFCREVAAHYREAGSREGVARFLQDIRSKPELRAQCTAALSGVDPLTLIDEIYEIDRRAQSVGAEFRQQHRPLSEVAEWVRDNKIGEIQESWSAPLHPGTIIRTTTARGEQRLYVTLFGPACESPRECRVLDIDAANMPDEQQTIRKYLSEASLKADKRSTDSDAKRGIPSIVSKASQREALIKFMDTYDTLGMKVNHLLEQKGLSVEFYSGEEWHDLRAQRLV